MATTTTRAAMRAAHGTPSRSHPSSLGDGWAGLILVSVCRSYLILLATLAGIACLPGLLGGTASVVQSGSMEPHMSPGDVVITSPLPADSPLPVERVITFHVDDMLVVHRLVSVKDDGSLVTAGDANPQLDPWHATRGDITGTARLLVPYVGLPAFWLGHDNMRAFSIWAALTTLALLLTGMSVGLKPPRGTRTGTPRHGSTEPPAPGARAGAVGRTAATAGVAALLLVPMAASAPASYAAGVFSDKTRTSASWTAKSYASISVGAMAGYGLIAASSVRAATASVANSSTTGSIATSPGTTVSGFRSSEIGGRTDLNNAAAKAAVAAATTARTALNQQDVTQKLSPALSGTVARGVYTSTTGAFTIPGALTLDAKGDSSARFVFITTSTLTMAQSSRITLTNGAKAANVWWVVGTTAVLGATTNQGFGADATAVGTYLVNGSADIRETAVVGRVVSYTGSVNLSASAVSPTN